MVTPMPVPVEPAVWTDPSPPVEPLPDFAASESAAINLVSALQYFAHARDVIVEARKAEVFLRDQGTLVETLQGHIGDLQSQITQTEAAFETVRLTAERETAAALATLDADLEAHTEATRAARAAIDAEFAVYRDGPIAEQRATLTAEMTILTERQAVLRGQVSDLERRAAEAQAQLDLVRSMVAGKV